jgi:ribosomal protein L31
MLIFAPSTKEQRNYISIGHTNRDRIDAAYCRGDIAFLFHSAMQVCRLKQNSHPTYTGQNRSAQQAADNDEYQTAVSTKVPQT